VGAEAVGFAFEKDGFSGFDDGIQSTARGGFDGVDKVFQGGPNMSTPEESSKWLNQAGLVVAFLLDGNDKKVLKAREKLHKAIALFREKPDKGKKGLEKALKSMSPAEVRETVKDSGLRGRGGGGFPRGHIVSLACWQMSGLFPV